MTNGMKFFIFFSEILGKRVVDMNGRSLGTLCDIPMKVGEEVYPKSLGFLIRKGILFKSFAFIPMADVKETDGILRVKADPEHLAFQRMRPKFDFTLCVDILDQQVVDTDNQKVVRVNDVHLLRVDNHFYLAHVDVGLRALIRRLEWTPVVDFLVKLFKSQSSYLTREDFLPWKNTQALTLGRQKNVLRLDVAKQKLSQIPAVELAGIMQDLDIYERRSLFRSLDVLLQRKVFTDIPTQQKRDLIAHLDDREAANLLENIPADESTDVLVTLPKEKALHLMFFMETKQSRKLRKLLGFASDSAGGLMTTEYLWLNQSAKVRDALQLVKDNSHQSVNIYHIYIVDDQHHLVGSTSVRQFIAADPESPLASTASPRNIYVKPNDGMEEIALLLEKYKISSIPVVSEDGILQGAITIDDVMEELISLAWTKYKNKLT